MVLDKKSTFKNIHPLTERKSKSKTFEPKTKDQLKKESLAPILQKDIDRILLEKVMINKDLSIKLIMGTDNYSKYIFNEINKKFEPLSKDNLSFLVNKKMSLTLDGDRIEYNPLALRNLYDNVCNTSKINSENIIKSDDSLNVIGLKNGYLIYKNNQLVFEPRKGNEPRKFYVNYVDKDYNISLIEKPNKELSKYFFSLMNNNAELTEYLLCVLSSILIPNNILQKFFVFVGRGGNGKNVLEEVIKNVLGSENFSNMSPNDFKRDDYILKASGTLVNWTPDLHGGLIESSDKLKAISSGDSVEGRALYGKSSSLKMNTKIFINSNKQLNLDSKSEDGGIRRRIVVVPFDKKYSSSERDIFNSNRKKFFSKKNSDWLFNYLISYANKVLEKGVTKTFALENAPEKIKEMFGNFLENTNYLIDFMEEMKPLIIEEYARKDFIGLVWKDRDGCPKICFENLYSLYVNYCRRGAFRPLNIKNFVEKILEEEWFTREKKANLIPSLSDINFSDLRRNYYDFEKTKREIVERKTSRQVGIINDNFLSGKVV